MWQLGRRRGCLKSFELKRSGLNHLIEKTISNQLVRRRLLQGGEEHPTGFNLD